MELNMKAKLFTSLALTGATIIACLMAPPISAQTTNAPQPTAQAAPRDTFHDKMTAFGVDLEKLTDALAAARERADKATTATPESKKEELRALEDKVREFGKTLSDGGPLTESINRFDSWVAAQASRLNNARDALGREWVEQMIEKYKAMQTEVTSARQKVDSASKMTNSMLREMHMVEARAAELLTAYEAEAAVRELSAVISKIETTVAEFRKTLTAVGSVDPGT
jgi:chromosome segregation ATPase